MPLPNLHTLTNMQLEAIIRDLEAEVRQLRENIHDLGPSVDREHAIDERRHQLEAVIRELGRRHR